VKKLAATLTLAARLHRGAAPHECSEAADSYLPHDPGLWTIERFVDEVEQVRVAFAKVNYPIQGRRRGGASPPKELDPWATS
jgi:hypothetical protein